MKHIPDLDTVANDRRDAFKPALSTPRIGIPDADADDTTTRELTNEALTSTAQDLKTIAEARTKDLDNTCTPGMAALLTVLSIIGAVIVAVLGVVLYTLGMAMDLSGGE